MYDYEKLRFVLELMQQYSDDAKIGKVGLKMTDTMCTVVRKITASMAVCFYNLSIRLITSACIRVCSCSTA